MIYYR